MANDPRKSLLAELTAEQRHQLVESIRDACVEAALKGYEEAAASGLCHDGAWEAAVGAMRMLDVDQLLERIAGAQESGQKRP